MIHPTRILILFERKSHCERAERVRQSPPEVPGFSPEIAAVAPLPREDLGRLNSHLAQYKSMHHSIPSVFRISGSSGHAVAEKKDAYE